MPMEGMPAIPMEGMPIDGIPIGSMPGIIPGIPIPNIGMGIGAGVVLNRLAIAMNLAEALRFSDRSHRIATACWCGGRA